MPALERVSTERGRGGRGEEGGCGDLGGGAEDGNGI